MPDLAVSEYIAQQLVTYEGETQGHRERVAAWCTELAMALHLRPVEAAALQEAALLHGTEVPQNISPSPDAESILAHFRGDEGRKDAYARVASLLTIADRFDGWTDSALVQSAAPGTLLDRCSSSEDLSQKAASYLVKRLRRSTVDELKQLMARLPVYPAVAMRLYALLSDSRVSLGTLEQLAKSDQVLAGKLIRASNSAFYSPVVPICTISKAIGYVGTEDARRILLASALQPLFATETMRKQWEHSLQSAAYAERIADLSNGVDKAEAFLLGLLHDAGRLALSLLPTAVSDSIDRLCDRGCPATVAESVVCGVDHAEAGAHVLAFWKFPASAVEAVRHHHRPELSESPLASVLYLAEVWSDGDGEPVNEDRYRRATQILGAKHSDLLDARHRPIGALSGL